jgi:hypothetical protein
MRLSRYFHELRTEYEAELDDLRTDSDGAHVLDRRLADKRRAFDALLPLIGDAPVMVASCLHRAFSFERASRQRLHALLDGEPGGFPSWAELAAEVGVAGWAAPLVDRALAEDGGEDFLATALGLEFLMHASGAAAAVAAEDEPAARDGRGRGEDVDRGDGDERDADDEGGLDEEGLSEDFLEQQGFDRRTER